MMVVLNNKSNSSDTNAFWREGDVIHVRLTGRQTAHLAQRALVDFKRFINDVKNEGHEPLVYVDLTGLKLEDVTVDARLAMKEAFKQPYTALAAVGKIRLFEVAMYLINASGANKRVRYFMNGRAAVRWLHARQTSTVEKLAGIVLVAAIIGLVGLAGLLGWATNNEYLSRFVLELRPINPMAAVSLIILCFAIIAQWYRQRRLTNIAAGVLIVIGILALLPTNIDYWLFGQQVLNAGVHAQFASSAARLFIIIGILFWLQWSNRKIARLAHMILAVIVVGAALLNMYGLLYAQSFMYSLSPALVMSLPLSLALALCGAALGLDKARRHKQQNIFGHTSRLGWMIALILIIVQIATYSGWMQAVNRTQMTSSTAFQGRIAEITDAAQTRIRAYTDALNGFRGLYAASDYVDQGEFEAYYNETQLTKNYPGVLAVSFIAKVDSKDLPAFLATHRADKSIVPDGHPSLVIQQQSKSQTHYIATYIAGNPTSTSMGVDLTDSPGRLAAYQKAESTSDSVSSGTVHLASSNKDGFFVTIPVQGKHPAAQANAPVIGFVNVVFQYDDLFANIFKSASLTNDIKLSIADSSSSKPIFSVNHTLSTNQIQARDIQIPAVDHTWDISIKAASDFGIDKNASRLPLTILFAGQAFSVLLLIIFLVQNGARRRALELANDITADLQQERNEAIATQKKDDTIFSGIAEGLIITNKNGVITRVNEAVVSLLGFTMAELVGKKFNEILLAYDQKGVKIEPANRPITRTIKTGRVVEQRLRYKRKDGTLFDAQLTNSPLIIGGKVEGAIEVFRDITKEQELDRAKSDFVSLASHQLRTPLSAINWYSEMLLSGDMGKMPKAQYDQVREIFEGNQRMIELVDSLLNVSRIEVGKLRNQAQNTSLNELADSLLRELDGTIKARKINLNRKTPSDLPEVFADPKLLRMILQNLLSNAIKYTADKGTVNLVIRRATANDALHAKLPHNKPYLFISVVDTGYGIPKTQQSKIFGKLYRADNVQKLDVEGTGLGLYIVKEVVDMLGGRIWFDSAENVGSSFYVMIPVKTQPS